MALLHEVRTCISSPHCADVRNLSISLPFIKSHVFLLISPHTERYLRSHVVGREAILSMCVRFEDLFI